MERTILAYVWGFAHTELICLYFYLKLEFEDFLERPSLVYIAYFITHDYNGNCLSLLFFTFSSNKQKENEFGPKIGVLVTSEVLSLNEVMLFQDDTEAGTKDGVLY